MCNNKNQRKARTIRCECLSFLENVGTLGCFFEEELRRERSENHPYMWDEATAFLSTIIVSSDGKKKLPFKITKRDDGKMAIVPIEKGDFVLRSWVLPKKQGRRSARIACLIYRVSEIRDTVKVLKVENFGIAVEDKVWWKRELIAELEKVSTAAVFRAQYYRSASPFVVSD